MNELPKFISAGALHWAQATPLLFSGASTLFAVARAHQLSRAEASSDPLLRFLVNQSDLVMVLCGSTAIWYAVARHAARRGDRAVVVDPQLVRQLRQVLSALLLGIGLLERRIEQGAYNNLVHLVQRLRVILRQGTQVLEQLESAPQVVAVVANQPDTHGSGKAA